MFPAVFERRRAQVNRIFESLELQRIARSPFLYVGAFEFRNKFGSRTKVGARWRGAAFFVIAILLACGTASAQTYGQRPSPPQAVEGWTPTAPQLQQA